MRVLEEDAWSGGNQVRSQPFGLFPYFPRRQRLSFISWILFLGLGQIRFTIGYWKGIWSVGDMSWLSRRQSLASNSWILFLASAKSDLPLGIGRVDGRSGIRISVLIKCLCGAGESASSNKMRSEFNHGYCHVPNNASLIFRRVVRCLSVLLSGAPMRCKKHMRRQRACT